MKVILFTRMQFFTAKYKFKKYNFLGQSKEYKTSIISTYMNVKDRDIDIVEQFGMVFDRVAWREKHHDLLLTIFLQESEQ